MRNKSTIPKGGGIRQGFLDQGDSRPRQRTDIEMIGKIGLKRKAFVIDVNDKDKHQAKVQGVKDTDAEDTDERKTLLQSMAGSARNPPQMGPRSANQEKNRIYKDQSYDIWDLTYTLITSNIPIVLLGTIFFFLVTLRYYTLACLLYIGIKSNARHMMWLIVVIGDRIIYLILVMKISLKTPETKTEISLKRYWNAKDSEISELFEVVNMRKLLISFLRGIIPAELAFVYIKASPKKTFQIFMAINYIYSSIQCIVYYPFFIAYTSVLTVDNDFGLDIYYGNATLALAVLAELIMLIFTLVLFIMGVRRKYNRFFWCYGK